MSITFPDVIHSNILHSAVVVLAIAAGGMAPHPPRTATEPAPRQGEQRAGQPAESRTESDIDQTQERRTDPTARVPDPARDTAQDRATGDRDDTARDSDTEMEDAMITARVKAALLADSDVAGLRIDVDTVRGEVRLQGEVENRRAIDEARRLAEAVDGVRRVATDGLRIAGGRRDAP